MDAAQTSDQELLQRCIAGERRAWNLFVERFTRYIYYLIKVTARRYAAEMSEEAVADLHNDVFLALMEDDCRRLRAFEGRNGCSVRSWIRVITIRKALDALRRRKVQISLDAMQDAGRPETADQGPDPLGLLLEQERQVRWGTLGGLVAQLKPQDQTLLHLLYTEKLSVEATAAALRITQGTLYTRKTRLIKKLRALAQAAQKER